MARRWAVWTSLMGILWGCDTAGDARERAEAESTRAQRAVILFERFPSKNTEATGVVSWKVAAVTRGGDDYVVARGDGPEGPVIDVVRPTTGTNAGRVFVMPPSPTARPLDDRRVDAIRQDLYAMGASAEARTSSTSVSKTLTGPSPLADEPLLGPATQLLERACATPAASEPAGPTTVCSPDGTGECDFAVLRAALEQCDGGDAEPEFCHHCQPAWGPNDVSFLFPYHTRTIREDERGYDRLIRLDEILPASTFDSVISALSSSSARRTCGDPIPPIELDRPRGSATLGANRLERWRIVSFRFDPCAPPPVHVVPASGDQSEPDIVRERCLVELRVIAQPFRDFVGDDGVLQHLDGDTTMHLFYRFGAPGSPDRTARGRIIASLARLKSASPRPTTGVALARHPGLEQELSGGASFGQAVREFLVDATREGALSQIAFMGVGDRCGATTGDTWEFSVGRVDGQRFTLLGIEQIEGSGDVQAFTSRSGGGGTFPASRARFSREELGDPRATTLRSVSCVDCHLLAANANPYNMRHFGFHDGIASITSRTAAETDAVLEYLRGL